MQNHYNLIYREEEREMIPLCRDYGVALIPWSPLARGVVAGNRKAGAGTTRARTDAMALRWYNADAMNDAVVSAVETVAARHGVKPVQVALAWHLHKPGITAPIIGASKPGQLEELTAAVAVRLTADDIAALEAPYVPQPILGHE
jgi:aryl-alcohol dehydrogenase (NADP+)